VKLTLEDIADLRAYERGRDDFRRHVIALKKKRRVPVGPHVTFLFENRDTIRFQIQEMARAEKILTDEGIQTELDIYNPLIPEPGHLCATLFIELTNDADLREWLPRLVGIERSVALRLPGGRVVTAAPDPAHAEQLTRDGITASVHYLGFALAEDDVAAVRAGGPVALAVAHPNHPHQVELDASTLEELAKDLAGG